VDVDLGDGKAGMSEEAGDGLEIVAGFFAEKSCGRSFALAQDKLRE